MKNNQGNSYNGKISCSGYITIENCSILGNEGPTGFNLIYKEDGSVTVKNCYVQSSPTIQEGIDTDNIKYGETYLNLSHLSTFNCEAPIPIIYNHENKINKEDDTLFDLKIDCCIYIFE